MTIEVINEQKRMSVLFADSYSFEEISGKHPDTYNYYYYSEKHNMFWLNTTSNLFDSKFEVSNNTKNGLNEDGSTFYQNSWTGIRFSITFSVLLNKVFNTLRSTIRYKNEPLKVIVTVGDETYTGYFILNTTSLEGGSLEFESAYSGIDGFWNCGSANKRFWLRHHKPAYVQDTPNKFLGKYSYPKTLEFDSDIDAPIRIVFHRIFNYESWVEDRNSTYKTTLKFTHNNTGVVYEMEFFNGYDEHIFDSNNFTHTYNGNPAQRPSKFMNLTGGSEQFELEMHTYKTTGSDTVEIETIPDFRAYIEFQFDDLRSGIYV